MPIAPTVTRAPSLTEPQDPILPVPSDNEEEEDESEQPPPKVKTAKDYIGESRALMQQIKRARDLSMLSANGHTTSNDPEKDGTMNLLLHWPLCLTFVLL